MSIDNHRVVAFTDRYLEKVSLSFGRSITKDEGRYFAAWEKKEDANNSTGSIYSSHSEPDISSPFTTPVCLDSIESADIGKCNNPKISSQYGDLDNDSANLTSVVLYEKYNNVTNRYDLKGYYNLQPTTSNYFKPISFSDPSHYNRQSSIAFNPFDSIFMVTYFDSTGHKLPFLTNDFNLENPNQWDLVSSGYNDYPVTIAPYPRVIINEEEESGTVVWIADGTGEKGVAMFDAVYSTYTNFQDDTQKDGISIYRIYPNPCSSHANISFSLQNHQHITLTLYSLLGSYILTLVDNIFPPGNNNLLVYLKDLPTGTYLFTIRSETTFSIGKLCIINEN